MSKQETEPIIRASEGSWRDSEMSLNSHLPPLRESLLLSTMTQKHCEDLVKGSKKVREGGLGCYQPLVTKMPP